MQVDFFLFIFFFFLVKQKSPDCFWPRNKNYIKIYICRFLHFVSYTIWQNSNTFGSITLDKYDANTLKSSFFVHTNLAFSKLEVWQIQWNFTKYLLYKSQQIWQLFCVHTLYIVWHYGHWTGCLYKKCIKFKNLSNKL